MGHWITSRRLGFLAILALAGAARAQSTINLPPLTPFQIIGVQCGQPPVTTIATGFAGAYATTWSSSSTTCGGSGRGGGYHTTTYSGCATARYTLTGVLEDVTRVTCGAAPDPGLVFQNDTGYSESTSGNLAVLGLPDPTPTYSWIGVDSLSVPLASYRQFEASIVNDGSAPLHVYSVNTSSTAVSAYPVDPSACAEVDLDPGASCAFTVGVYAGNGEVNQGTIAFSAVTSSLAAPVFQQPVTITDPVPACSDGWDNDGDGFIDFDGGASVNGGVPLGLPDPGCRSAMSATESPQCQDGIDNDGDGFVDFDGGASVNGGVAFAAPDPQCVQPYQNNEATTGCGLGAELVGALPLLAWLGGRRRRRARS
jgi:hypothetical protein